MNIRRRISIILKKKKKRVGMDGWMAGTAGLWMFRPGKLGCCCVCGVMIVYQTHFQKYVDIGCSQTFSSVFFFFVVFGFCFVCFISFIDINFSRLLSSCNC